MQDEPKSIKATGPPESDRSIAALERGLAEITKLRTPANDGVHVDFLKTLERETDRGKALVTAAFFEERLEELLRGRFLLGQRRSKSIELLFQGFGPLSTFSGKISLAYAFSLISDGLEHDLHLVRKLRNEFAHSITTKDFTDSKINQLIGGLYTVGRYVPPSHPLKRPGDDARQKFAYASGTMSALLQASIGIVRAPDIPMSVKEEIFSRFANTAAD